jgi:hypothetical protein
MATCGDEARPIVSFHASYPRFRELQRSCKLYTGGVKVPRKGRELWAILDERSIPEPNTGCLLWLGATTEGYATIMYRNHLTSVARLLLNLGPGEIACHRCDNRACIEPRHLYGGTYRDNMSDAFARNRYRRNDDGRFARGKG